MDDARAIVDRFTETAGESPQGLMLQARISFFDEDWPAVERVLLQVLQKAPTYRPAQMLLGAAHLRSGNVAQAEMYLSAAVSAEPNDPGARRLLAQAQLQMLRASDAQEILAPLVESDSPDAESMQLAIQASLANRDLNGAIEYLQRSLESDPENTNLRLQLAVVLIEAARTDEAQRILDSVDATESSDTAYRHRSLIIVRMLKDGQSGAALSAAQQLVETYPDVAGAFNLLGSIHRGAGDVELAMAAFDRALMIEPNNSVALSFRAQIDESRGDAAAAMNRYQAVLERDPDAGWAADALGQLAGRRGEHSGAAEYFRIAVDSDPSNANYRSNLAKAHYSSGDTAAALAVLADKPELSESFMESGLLYAMLTASDGDLRGAMSIVKRGAVELPGRT